jgi:leucyl-tRNA synthetase
MILGLAYKTQRGVLVPSDRVEWRDGKPWGAEEEGGEMEMLTEFPAKMSKSLRNVVNPDDVIREYGADSLRLYEMFMGPLQAVKPWATKGVEGVFRFLKRVNKMVTEQKISDRALTSDEARVLHSTIKKVSEDLEALSFNTAISAMMVFTNAFAGDGKDLPREAAEKFVLLVAPFAPHLGEELWEFLGHDKTLAYEAWPTYDPAALVESEIEIPVQVLGKLRGRLDAMEVIYSEYDEKTTETSAALVKEFGLLPSGGSDFHGKNKPDISLGTGRGGLNIPLSFARDMGLLD